MDKEKLIELYNLNKAPFNGAMIGLVISIVILTIGVIKTLFIAMCICIGYYIGNALTNDKNYITNLLDRILPPGTYR